METLYDGKLCLKVREKNFFLMITCIFSTKKLSESNHGFKFILLSSLQNSNDRFKK